MELSSVCVCVCVSLQAAIANEGGDLQKAQQHHKRAQGFNLAAAVTLITTGVAFIITIFFGAYGTALALS